jgi:2'-5' RNA ligase
LRSFIAIELPERAKSVLAELQREFEKCGADIRWVRTENIHLTLKFLGDIEENAVAAVTEKIKGTCNKYMAFSLNISGAGVFPNARSPRVLWVGLNSSETMTGLQGEIDNEMASLGFERENRRFVPHLTLGRFKSSRGRGKLLEKVEAYKESEFGLIDVNSVSLMRSDLGPAGAKHTRIADFKLQITD